MRLALIASMFLLLSGCDKWQPKAQPETGRFQIVTLPVSADAPGVGALILDTANGDLWHWSKSGDKTNFTFMGRSVTEIIQFDKDGHRMGPSVDVLLKKYGIESTTKP